MKTKLCICTSINGGCMILCVYIVCTYCIVFICSLQGISVLFFHTTPFSRSNKAGLLAWLYTCHFYMYIAGWVEHLTHLSFYSVAGGACALLVGSYITLQGVSLPPLLHRSLLGCVAATLNPLLTITS